MEQPIAAAERGRMAKQGDVVDHHDLVSVQHRTAAAEADEPVTPRAPVESALLPDMARAGAEGLDRNRLEAEIVSRLARREQPPAHALQGMRHLAGSNSRVQRPGHLAGKALHAGKRLGQEPAVDGYRLHARTPSMCSALSPILMKGGLSGSQRSTSPDRQNYPRHLRIVAASPI